MILSLLLAAAQATQPLPAPLPPGLLRSDANRDGVITRAEATASADARFARFDADRDGSVTRREQRQAKRAAREARRAQPVTAAEFQRKAQARFARLDANRDGVLTAEERPQRRGMRGRGEGRMGEGGGERGMRGPGRGGPGVAITAVQFRTRALARFDAVDANRDGRVDQAEIAARRAAPQNAPRG